MQTHIVKVAARGSELGRFREAKSSYRLEEWCINTAESSLPSIEALRKAGAHLREKDTPVGFPTETVYGLGADATRSAAVKGIYSAKGRPSDNPLIVHVCDLQMLRYLLGTTADGKENALPERYKKLIDKFWPGPLTILLPNAQPSRLAPEVTAGLSTFGVRMPSSTLALSLIKLAGVPLAAPSANASTKPSPTAAHHVKHDLDGRIELILDGGPSHVGVESTARVVLYETTYNATSDGVVPADIESADATQNGHATNGHGPSTRKFGVIRTKRWGAAAGLNVQNWRKASPMISEVDESAYIVHTGDLVGVNGQMIGELFDIDLGKDTAGIAQGLFSALRELDSRGAETIFVDGIDGEMNISAAVMNRLRKAASEIRS
ncbi:hypothetical protein NQ176_g3446 [Zarea fungicola]|uniref:Uncharacterized protein n=1 Tax=Zarea fungicola TaxID=93591 RepID=A0ACC1NJM3_9HYPO|nr:hypothetical protein NQ176_g3446 [Lecanicillium fungicola]